MPMPSGVGQTMSGVIVLGGAGGGLRTGGRRVCAETDAVSKSAIAIARRIRRVYQRGLGDWGLGDWGLGDWDSGTGDLGTNAGLMQSCSARRSSPAYA